MRLPTLAGLPLTAVLLAAPLLAQEEDALRPGERLEAPPTGSLNVAFLVSPGATVIDFAGPWEVFQDVMVPGRGDGHADAHPFRLYTVAASTEPIRASAGLQIIPDYAYADAPQPDVIVVPAGSSSSATQAWLREAAAGADMTMSVCTGSFLLASIGLLDGRSATTHHDSLHQLAGRYPQISVRRDVRYVEGPRVATAAGLTSGVDLALRVVERYFGTEVAERTASYMEHESDAWRTARGHWDDGGGARVDDPDAIVHPAVLDGHDPVLLVDGEQRRGRRTLSAEHDGYEYLFTSEETRRRFLATPTDFAVQYEGACAFMAASGGAGPRSGSPTRFAVHEGRIYLFASDGCRRSFLADPARFAVKT